MTDIMKELEDFISTKERFSDDEVWNTSPENVRDWLEASLSNERDEIIEACAKEAEEEHKKQIDKIDNYIMKIVGVDIAKAIRGLKGE